MAYIDVRDGDSTWLHGYISPPGFHAGGPVSRRAAGCGDPVE
ncbi:hypothetical protein [Nocardia sp. NBC_01377]